MTDELKEHPWYKLKHLHGCIAGMTGLRDEKLLTPSQLSNLFVGTVLEHFADDDTRALHEKLQAAGMLNEQQRIELIRAHEAERAKGQ